MKSIESTGNVLTIEQREQKAPTHIVHALARIGQQCLILGHRQAANHCEQPIAELKKAAGVNR